MEQQTDAQLRASSMAAASRFAFLWAWVVAQEQNLGLITTQTNLACQSVKVDPPLFTLAYLKKAKADLKAMKASLNQYIQSHMALAKPNTLFTIEDSGAIKCTPQFSAPPINISPADAEEIARTRLRRFGPIGAERATLRRSIQSGSLGTVKKNVYDELVREATTASLPPDTSREDDEVIDEAWENFKIRMRAYGMSPTIDKNRRPREKPSTERAWWD